VKAERVWIETFRGKEVQHSEAIRNITSTSAVPGFVSIPIIDDELPPREARLGAVQMARDPRSSESGRG
jgi:hypothetical protein